MDKFGAPGVEDGLKNRENPVKFDFLDLFWFLQRLLCNCASTRPPVVQTDGLVVTGGEGGLTILSPVILSFFPHSGRGRDRPRSSSTGLREHLVPVSYFSEHHT